MTTRNFFAHGVGIAALLIAMTTATLRAAPLVPDAPDAPHRQAESFLKFHLTHDSGLTPKSVEARRKWLSLALYRLLQKEIVRQNAFSARHPGDVPFIDGDVFTSSQEPPTGFAVSAAPRRRGTALVPVTFRFGEKPRRAVYQMRLSNGSRPEQWQIDDVVSEGGKPGQNPPAA